MIFGSAIVLNRVKLRRQEKDFRRIRSATKTVVFKQTKQNAIEIDSMC